MNHLVLNLNWSHFDLLSRLDLFSIQVVASCLVWPVVAVWFFMFMHWTIQGDLDWSIGIPALFATLLLGASVTWIRDPIYSPIIGLALLLALIALPFVMKAMDFHILKRIDRDQIHRAIDIAQQSRSKAPLMRLATQMYESDYGNWAVAFAEQALPEMPQSMFPHEHAMYDAWKQMGYSSGRAEPLICTQCSRTNGPQNIVCAHCGHEYLVDYVTGTGSIDRVMGRRLIGAWCMAMLLLVGIPASAAYIENKLVFATVIGVLIALAGWVFSRSLYWNPGSEA